MRACALTLLLLFVSAFVGLVGLPAAVAAEDFTAFESGPVRPLALSADGTRLFAVNTPDNRLEIFAVGDDGLKHNASVFVGLEPVAVAVRSATEVWVVNHLSDSISIVAVDESPRVTRTLLVGDEPRDIVFAGPDRSLAFVTTAHRGQNSPIDPQPFTPSVGRADVWVLDAANLGTSLDGDPRRIIPLFGDSPRALAASPDGHTVYAGIFLSGNRTAAVAEEAVCDGGFMAAPCSVNVLGFPGGLPLPNANSAGVPAPETGLIVKYNANEAMWQDEFGRNWNNAARFRLPDKDVFAIDAFADPPHEMNSYAGVGTVLYGMAVNPANGALYVANTDARNEVRLETRVRGHQHESHLTIIDSGGIAVRDLNKHLDCSPLELRSPLPCDDNSPVSPKASSLALPTAVAVSDDGATVYIAGYGSAKVAVYSADALRDDSFTPDVASQIELSAGGPAGLVIDTARQRLYVATRFDNGISSVDLSTNREVAHLAVFNPEPEFVRNGRRFLYDADFTSANGEAACASCHVFADFDGLGWDLGDPDGPVLINDLPLLNAQDRLDMKDFHPLKGPMTTQTLQGLRGHGPMHWRGDRNGALEGGDPMDERAAFRQFNPAFVGLLGRDEELTAEQMEVFTDFILDITPPPNPYRPLDDSLTPTQQTGRDAFFQNRCFECHELDPANLRFGTSRKSAVNSIAPQFMKVPQLRGTYKKIGRFYGVLFQPFADPLPLGDQIRGFGYQHDGSAGRPNDPADAFLIAFDSNLKPAVGQQVTLTADAGAEQFTRATLLTERAAAGDCELVVRASVDGEERGWLRRGDGSFDGDRAGEAPVSDAELLDRATNGLTLTCVPLGSGLRLALDRDRDGALDGDERLAGTDPSDAASFPGAVTPTPPPGTTPPSPTPTPTFEEEPTQALECVGDCDGDNLVGASDVREGIALIFGGSAACDPTRFDRNADGRVAVAEILNAIRTGGCQLQALSVARR